MAWEIYRKQHNRAGTPTVTLSTTGRIVLNRISTDLFKEEKMTRVDLLWDREQSKVGLRSNRKGMYHLNFAPKMNGAVISASTFLNYIKYDWTETRSFPAKWDSGEKILMLEIPKEHLQSTGAIRRKDKVRNEKKVAEEQPQLRLGRGQDEV